MPSITYTWAMCPGWTTPTLSYTTIRDLQTGHTDGLVVMPGATSSLVATLHLVAMPEALNSFLLLVAMPFTFNFVARSFLLLVVRPGAPKSVLAPSRDARSPY